MIILERYEGKYAVLEVDGKIINVDKGLLKGDIKEGDLLILKDGTYYRDEEGTRARKEYMAARFTRLWKK